MQSAEKYYSVRQDYPDNETSCQVSSLFWVPLIIQYEKTGFLFNK